MNNTRQIPLKRRSTKYLTSFTQDCQGHQKQRKPEQLYSQEELKEI